jgi:hypothetical protein
VKNFIIAAIIGITGFIIAPAPAQAATPICAANAICFADLVGGTSTEGISGTIARNTCRNLTHPNTASEIDNETAVQWKVFTGSGCTGNVGTIFANTQGPMTGVFNNNIESAYRTSTP